MTCKEKLAAIEKVVQDSLANDPSWWDGPNKRIVEIAAILRGEPDE